MILVLEVLKKEDYEDFFIEDEYLGKEDPKIVKKIYEYINNYSLSIWANPEAKEEHTKNNAFCIEIEYKDIIKNLFTDNNGKQTLKNKDINECVFEAIRLLSSTDIKVNVDNRETYCSLIVMARGKNNKKITLHYNII